MMNKSNCWLVVLVLGLSLGGLAGCGEAVEVEKVETTLVPTATEELHDLESAVMEATVKMSVLLPPGYDPKGPELPLLINLHGGGGNREFPFRWTAFYSQLFNDGILPPTVIVSFAGGQESFYSGALEQFVSGELPLWANQQYGSSLDPQKRLLTGISMADYGLLKIGLKYPDQFEVVAPMEPAIMPAMERPEGISRSNWWLPQPGPEENYYPRDVSDITDSVKDGLIETVDLWAAAWSDQNVPQYIANYSENFAVPGGQSRPNWEALRRTRIKRPGDIKLDIEYQRFELIDTNVVDVFFRQAYRSNTHSDLTDKVLRFSKEGTDWKILVERSL